MPPFMHSDTKSALLSALLLVPEGLIGHVY